LTDDELARSCTPTRTPAVREARQPFDCREDEFDLPFGGGRPFARNVLSERGKVAQCPCGPDHLRHPGAGNSSGFPQERTQAATSSCAITRPASASRMPSSIAARCDSCTATNSLSACSTTRDLGRLSAVAIFATCLSSSGVNRIVSEGFSLMFHQSGCISDVLKPHHASRPRGGRAVAARCSASCLSNIARAAAERFSLSSSRCSVHQSYESMRGRLSRLK
jgi:hypothetical protein